MAGWYAWYRMADREFLGVSYVENLSFYEAREHVREAFECRLDGVEPLFCFPASKDKA